MLHIITGWHEDAFQGYLDEGLVDISKNIPTDIDGDAEHDRTDITPVTLSCCPSSESYCFRGVGKSVLNELKNIQCPVTIMVGGNTTHLDSPNRSTIEYYQSISSLFQNSKLVIVDNSSHFFPQELPQVVADEINRHLINLK